MHYLWWTCSFVRPRQFLHLHQILLLRQTRHPPHPRHPCHPLAPVTPVTQVNFRQPSSALSNPSVLSPLSPKLPPSPPSPPSPLSSLTSLLQPCDRTRVTPLFHIYYTPVTVIQSCRPLHFLADFYLKSKLYSSTSATYTVYRGSRGLERQFRILIDRFPCSARGLCIRAPTSLQGNNVIALFVAIIKNDNI